MAEAIDDEKAAQDIKIREAFQILTQGVEMIHFDSKSKRASRSKKIVWLDSDILRICVDTARPTQKEMLKGKVPPGIYLRDIGEVREGANAYAFLTSAEPPENSDFCLSLIGTERTISLQLPSKFSRDWFLERFQLVIDDVLTDAEKSLRAVIKWSLDNDASKWADLEGGESVYEQMKKLLAKGLQVLHHHPGGRIIRSYLSFSEAGGDLHILPMEKSIFDFTRKNLTLNINDISEIRPGTHSIGFVRTNSTDKQGECLSIIGTECTIDLQLANNKARDLLVQKLRVFVSNFNPEQALDSI